jgi:hypothetical protein
MEGSSGGVSWAERRVQKKLGRNVLLVSLIYYPKEELCHGRKAHGEDSLEEVKDLKKEYSANADM